MSHKLTHDQVADLERGVSREEIRRAVWDCGENKYPGPDGFTFEFFRKYWNCIGPDFCVAVEHFFVNGSFSKGCNSSFVALIPKVTDAKFVNDYRPISLIGSVYKVVTKIMATRLAMVIESIVSDTQSAFVAKRQILDGPFILNEVLHWCKRKNKKVMFFKVDFAKAYDSVRWDFLIDVLEAFGFGSTWCNWVRGTFCYAKGSILVNGSPSNEFQFHRGLKQGDPLSPYLFILVMESLHLSVCRAMNDRLFNGIRLNGSLSLSHLFYADDALFIGEWSDDNLCGIIQILKCFHLASGLHINLNKSQLLGVGVPRPTVEDMANSIGCSIMKNKFRYLGIMVGDCMSRFKAWEDVVIKLRNRAELSEKKITWVAWDKVLASKKKGGLGVSSYYALNRALLLKWVWRFVPNENSSLTSSFIQAIHGSRIDSHSTHLSSLWSSILKEMHVLKDRGFDFLAKCSKRVDLFEEEWRKTNFSVLADILDTVSLSSSLDRWACLLSSRRVQAVPIKINIFTWRARRDCLPTRLNLIRRGVALESTSSRYGLFGERMFQHRLISMSFGSGGLTANMSMVGGSLAAVRIKQLITHQDAKPKNK
ncbi:RNA-directed DNA polymerase, eukaryota [Tanacetum coccineum]